MPNIPATRELSHDTGSRMIVIRTQASTDQKEQFIPNFRTTGLALFIKLKLQVRSPFPWPSTEAKL